MGFWQVERWGERVAVVAEDGRAVTYAELAALADAAAPPAGPRRLVVVPGANDLATVARYLGALRAGYAVLLADAASAPSLAAAYEDAADLHPDLALVMSTSGSTGSPKLVRLSYENLTSNAEAIAAYLGLRDDDRAVTSLPMHYCYGLSVLHSHLAVGAAVVLTSTSVVDPCFWAAVAEHGVTTLAGVPYTFDLLDRVGFASMDVPSLRRVTQAGGRLAAERVRAYAALGRATGWSFFVMYGQTEATARMAYLPPALAERHPDCIGGPIPGGAFRLDDGELVYRGPNVMLGYATAPADLALGRTVHELRTGDMAEEVDGLYRIVGRRSRFVKPFGLRVDLDHVERRLRAAGVEAACAGDDTRVVVAAESPARVDVVEAAVREVLTLPSSAVHVEVVGVLPRLPSGKTDYAALHRLAPPPPASSPSPSPTAASVKEVVAKAVGCRPDDVRDDDTFVGLGGDSLSYVEVSVALEEALGALPADWHVRPVASLQPARSTSRVRRVETGVVVRALAILLVVATHTDLVPWEGGAHALLVVAGLNFARFQLASGRILRSAVRIALPSMAFIGGMAALRDDFGWPHALLVNGFLGADDSRWAYWYIEALVVLLVALGGVLAIARVRALERRRPLAFAGAVLAVGLAVRFDLLGLPDLSHRVARPHNVVWLFALGWAAAHARTPRHRAALTAVALAAIPGFFGDAVREGVVLAAALALVWLRTLPVVAPLNRAVGAVANASLWIYLTHWAVYPVLDDVLPPLLVAAACVALPLLGQLRQKGVRPAAVEFPLLSLGLRRA